MKDELIKTVINKEDEKWIYGTNFYGNNGIVSWKTDFMQPKSKHWTADSVYAIFNERMGLHVDNDRITELSDLFDDDINLFYYIAGCIQEHTDWASDAVKLILGPVAARMNELKVDASKIYSVIRPHYIFHYLECLHQGKFNKSFAKEFFAEWIESHKSAHGKENIVLALNKLCEKYSVSDNNKIKETVENVFSTNPEQVQKAKDDPKLVNWLVGQGMKLSKGQFAASELKNAIIEKLGNE